jgi:tRNA A-37 threonylcarbamoyl transferase component Bud32
MNGPTDLEQQLRAALGATYDITREMAGGGMSRVFLAQERTLDRPVVIKVLPPELAAGVNRERFQREIQLAARLQHPHIVPLFSAGAIGDVLYYTMPFIAGESLKHALAAGTRFSVREAVRILRDVADALAYAHSHGIVHRDIKPANVLRSGGHAVVTDFGVAKALNSSLPGTAMTSSGMAIGTPAYMAPEQLAGDPAADHRVDIYAVGLLGYELFTGSNPFSSPSPQETLASQMTREPEQLSVRRPEIPVALSALIGRCLAKNPDQRPQTAAQLVAELDALISTSGDFAPQRMPAARRAWWIGGAGVAAAGALALWFALSPGVAPEPGTPPVAPPPPVPAATSPTPLSSADSLAIARAVEQKMAAARRARADSQRRAQAANPSAAAADPAALAAQGVAFADSLRTALFRSVMDSVSRLRGRTPEVFHITPPRVNVDSMRVYRGPYAPEAFEARAAQMGPARRVVVSPPRPRSDTALNAAALALADSLRKAVSGDPRFVLVPADSVSQVFAVTRDVDEVAARLHTELFISLTVFPMPDRSVMWQVTTRDLSASAAYRQRVVPLPVPRDSLRAVSDSLVAQTLRTLHEEDRAPRAEATGRGSGRR